jgi:hypothetical protein
MPMNKPLLGIRDDRRFSVKHVASGDLPGRA